MSSSSAKSPFKGLAPFEEDEWPSFHGRSHETRQILDSLRAAPLTLLYSGSGVGKSSLLQAGVLHHLRHPAEEQDSEVPLVVHLKDWQGDPLARVCKLLTQIAPPGKDDPPRTLGPLLVWCAVQTGRRIVLIFDQFEEILVSESDAAVRFRNELAPAVIRHRAPPAAQLSPEGGAGPGFSNYLPIHFLIALREDCLCQLHRLHARIPHLFDNQIRLGHLRKEAAVDAVKKPLLQALGAEAGELAGDAFLEELFQGVRADALPRRSKLCDDTPIDAAYLQIVLERLWNDRKGEGFRVEALKEYVHDDLTGVEAIVEEYVEVAFVGRYKGFERARIARALDYVVSVSQPEAVTRVRDLAVRSRLDAATLESLLNRLCSSAPVHPAEGASTDQPDRAAPTLLKNLGGELGNPAYTLAHHRLALPLRKWIEREKGKARQRAKWCFAGAAAALLAVVVVGVLVWTGRNEASRIARAERAAADVDNALKQQRLLMSLQRTALDLQRVFVESLSNRTDLPKDLPSEVNRVLDETAPAVEQIPTAPGGDSPPSVPATPTLQAPVTVAVSKWPVAGAVTSPASISVAGKPTIAVILIGSGETPHPPEIVHLSFPEGVLTQSRIPIGVSRVGVGAVAFDPSGSQFVLAEPTGTPHLFSTFTGAPVASLDGPASATATAFSRDGSRLVLGDKEGGVWVWTLAPKPLLEKIPGVQIQAPGVQRVPVADVFFKPDEGTVVLAALRRAGATLGSLDPQKRNPLHTSPSQDRSFNANVTCAAFSTGSGRIAIGGADGSVAVFNARTSNYWGKFDEDSSHAGEIKKVLFHPDMQGKKTQIAFFSNDPYDARKNQVVLWNHVTGKFWRLLSSDKANDINFNPDGSLLVIAGNNGTAWLWATDPPRQLDSLSPRGKSTAGEFSPGPAGPPLKWAAFSPDGAYVLTVDAEGTVAAWKTPTP
ncbi:MAG TPA: WD40 repeat domain-containing protein [Chthoniobacteraceae bacterium]|jgi:hypothetical protein|nr:WD40 repeat domain-containing protein [Chthoniobacteraceae bacterium]